MAWLHPDLVDTDPETRGHIVLAPEKGAEASVGNIYALVSRFVVCCSLL